MIELEHGEEVVVVVDEEEVGKEWIENRDAGVGWTVEARVQNKARGLRDA